MKKCMVILNPSSGKEQALQYEQLIVSQFTDYDVKICYTEKEGDATAFAKQACEAQFDAVVLVGGDGTLNEGVNGIAEQAHRPTIGVVPLGTVNDFARALHIPLEPEEAIALLGGHTEAADIGKVNERYFTNIVAIGEIAQSVGDVSIEEKSKIGAWAYLKEGIKVAISPTTFHITLQIDGETIEEEAYLFLCVLTNSVGSFQQMNAEADVADGLLHIFILKGERLLDVAFTAKNLLSGQYDEDERIIKLQAQELSVSLDRPYELNVDGDNVSSLPAKIQLLPQHLTFYCEKM